jgi:hypothetical protein
MALLVNSVPLSLTIVLGLPRSMSSRSSSRATRMPEIEVSAISADYDLDIRRAGFPGDHR